MILWTGWEPWTSWLRVGSAVAWLEWPPNASLWGLAARLQSGMLKSLSLSALHPVAVGAVVAAEPSPGCAPRANQMPIAVSRSRYCGRC